MSGYGQFCSVAMACEVLAERWTPLVLRELLCGSHRFSDLRRGVPLMSGTLLTQRLRELEDAGVVNDAGLLMWDVHRRLNLDRLPSERAVVRFDFRGVPRGQLARKTWWLVLHGREVDLCLKDPGFDVALTVSADLVAFVRVWMGDLGLAGAMRARLITVDGPRELVRAFPTWLGLSLFAGIPRPSPARRHAPR